MLVCCGYICSFLSPSSSPVSAGVLWVHTLFSLLYLCITVIFVVHYSLKLGKTQQELVRRSPHVLACLLREYKQSVVGIRLSVSYWKSQSTKASFPGLPCSYLLFAFTIIHGSRRAAKNGEGLGAFIMGMTSGRCEVDGGEWGGDTQNNE